MLSRSLLMLLFVVGCASSQTQPVAWETVPQAKRIAPLCCVRKDAGIVRVDHGKLVANGKALTPEFRAIDSFDVSLERREVIFSAKRDKSFDIGLVSLDGSDVHWIPEDPADEVDVQWAPRGNKISYVIHAVGGDLVRTVHIPTAMQLSADFPYAVVHSLLWDPEAERYSVVVSSPDASDRVESMKYDGTARKMEIAASDHLDLDIAPVAGGIMLRPSLLRYNERLPLAIWIDDRPLEWNDARAALMKNRRLAIAVVKAMPEKLPDEPWIDARRVFLVDRLKPVHPPDGVVVVPHADVESLASGWIAQQLKEPNGR